MLYVNPYLQESILINIAEILVDLERLVDLKQTPRLQFLRTHVYLLCLHGTGYTQIRIGDMRSHISLLTYNLL